MNILSLHDVGPDKINFKNLLQAIIRLIKQDAQIKCILNFLGLLRSCRPPNLAEILKMVPDEIRTFEVDLHIKMLEQIKVAQDQPDEQ